jgi:hypothetical protein
MYYVICLITALAGGILGICIIKLARGLSEDAHNKWGDMIWQPLVLWSWRIVGVAFLAGSLFIIYFVFISNIFE